MLDTRDVTGEGRRIRAFWPETQKTEAWVTYYDYAGAALQSEPAQLFMRHSIYNWQSPFWDPYSGAGSFGPETLVDQKFAPFTLIMALVGPSPFWFHVVSLALITIAVFFVLLLLNRQCHLSPAASTLGAAVFLLNGYFMMNVNSNVAYITLFAPATLYCLFEFQKQPQARLFTLSSLCIALLLLHTFIPTTATTMLTIGILAISLSKSYRAAALTSLTFVAGALLVSFLYLPILDMIKYVGSLEKYGGRIFYPVNWQVLISLFTPKHMSLAYNLGDLDFRSFHINFIFHFGILAGFVAIIALLDKANFRKPLFWAIVLTLGLSLGRIFAVPGIYQLVSLTPFFGNVGCQYWWPVVGICFPFLAALGFQSLISGNCRRWPAVLLAAGLIVNLIFLLFNFGLPKDPNSHSQVVYYLCIFAALITSGIFIIYKSVNRHQWHLGYLVLLILELTFYVNHSRVVRTDYVNSIAKYAESMKRNIGFNRVANYGHSGLPAQLGAAFQIPQLETFAMNVFPDYVRVCNSEFLNDKLDPNIKAFCANFNPKLLKISPNFLNMMGVKYIIVSREMERHRLFFEQMNYPKFAQSPAFDIFENQSALPRMFVVPRLHESAATPTELGLEPKNVATTQDPVLLEHAQSLKAAAVPYTIANEEIRNTSLRATANLASPGILVLTDNWHPDWHVRVNGKEAHLAKVNSSFRGLALEAGESSIEMWYWPRKLTLGLWISGLTLLSLIFISLLQRSRNSPT